MTYLVYIIVYVILEKIISTKVKREALYKANQNRRSTSVYIAVLSK